ncbi:Mss4-like protein [Glarea lozoyensis ATCC 20868]|uniref:Mss4-like protein n=1 Tax=Glarea lozoyensis (strain ATCC 20868 / MF5171) TaxID=1116229 RepID=S3DCY9_GLAL2|nr:Mss4-like protein [Glarea lozoyensis ATCC 20868]EPE29846.1 Mss4-like protein [Glarea lozoyensis ATCC 20868]
MSSNTYTGSCHCHLVSFTVVLPRPLSQTEVCNCNCIICTKNGYLTVYPKKDDVVVKGEQELKRYEWEGSSCTHLFCGGCGSSLFVELKQAQEGRDGGRAREKGERGVNDAGWC